MAENIDKTNILKIFTNPLFPDDHKYLTFLKKVFRHEFRKNWFRRISTDILENWKFRKNAELWIMNAYLDNNCIESIQPIYYYYMDHFLGDNWEQEERIWWEIIWENDPILDAISIYLCYFCLKKIWLEDNIIININSIWVEKEISKYIEELQNFYANKKHLLTKKSLILLEKNPMLLLDSDDEDEKILASQAPSIIKFLKKESKFHYQKFKEYLDLLKVPYNEKHTLIPKNIYNTNSVWEFRSKNWKLIWNWARYNSLSKEIGYIKSVSATWFYVNTKVIIDILKEKKIKIRNKDKIDLFIVQLWDEAKTVVLPLSIAAREAWINTVVSLWTPSMKEQMLKANRSWAKLVVMVGIMEARNWIFQVRDIETWTQEEVKKDNLIDYVIWKIGKDKLDFYCPVKDLVSE